VLILNKRQVTRIHIKIGKLLEASTMIFEKLPNMDVAVV
jgi:hypothetical protein